MAGGFQTQVNTQPAPAVAGDFASANPRFTFDAGPGGLVAGPGGVTVARFAWANLSIKDTDNAPAVVNNFPVGAGGPPTGFVHRAQQALNTTFLSDASMVIPSGFPVTLFTGGDFFVKNDGATQALFGMKAYANYADGRISFAVTGAPLTSVVTASLAATTFAVTGSIADDIMTVTAVTSGTIVPGASISGTGIAAGTQIVSQLSGAAGGIGTYVVSIPEQSVPPATAIAGTYGTLTVTAVTSGALQVGDILTGNTIAAGTVITGLGTGVGGIGTYFTNTNTPSTSAATTGTSNIETKFIAMSGGAAGELVKISDHALG